MDDIWIISWFNHTAFDANPIWQSPNTEHLGGLGNCVKGPRSRCWIGSRYISKESIGPQDDSLTS